jgi:hypothetical protein
VSMAHLLGHFHFPATENFTLRMNPNKDDARLVEEAKKHPDGWVYVVDEQFRDKDQVPPECILGAWKVNSLGEIVGDFLPNPNYKKATEG